MQDVDVRELHKGMNNYIHPNYTPGLGPAPWEGQFFSPKLNVYPLWEETIMVLSLLSKNITWISRSVKTHQ